MKTTNVILLAIGIPLFLFGGCAVTCTALALVGGGVNQQSATTNSFVDGPVDIVTDAETVVSDYEANEIAGDVKYKGKIVTLSGQVSRIDSSFTGSPTVHLGKSFKTVAISGLSAEIASELRKGQNVTVTCRGSGEVIGFPQFRDCKLIQS